MRPPASVSRLQRFRWPLILIGVPLSAFGLVSVAAWMSPKPKTLGVQLGQLAACPNKPNCVISQASDGEHGMEPIARGGMTPEDAIGALAHRISRNRLATVVTHAADYLHVEYASRWFGFIDDVEFYAPADADVIHFRSASRLGHSDLGVNRKRMEEIRGWNLQER